MRLRTLVAWFLVLPWAGWALVRGLELDRGWPLVALIAFVPWAAAGAIASCLAALALRRRLPAAVAAVAAVVLVAAIAPRVTGDGAEPPRDAVRVRVLTVNLLGPGARSDAVVGLARRLRADVLSVQELTPEAAEGLEASGVRDVLPHAVLRARSSYRGSGLYARRALRPVPAPDTSAATASATLPVAGAVDVEVHAVHPQAPSNARFVPRWRRDLRALPPALPDGALRVLAGDLNATLDHRELRRLVGTGYRDAAASVGAGLRTTWPDARRLPPMVTIDHVLVDERAAVGDVSVHEVPGTDHRAVFAELLVPGR